MLLMMIAKFKNGVELPCINCSYICNKDPIIQILVNTTDYSGIVRTIESADTSEIKAYSNGVLVGTYTGYSGYDISATVLADFSLDVVINIKQVSLQEKVAEIEKSNSDALVRIQAIENANTIDVDSMTLDEYKEYRQSENNAALAAFLDKSSVSYNGKNYGVSQEDQTEMAINLVSYNLYQELGIPSILEWHAKKEECTEFTKEQFVELIVLVKSFVYPYLQYCQSIKASIFACADKESIKNIVVDYDNYTPSSSTGTEAAESAGDVIEA